MSDPDRPIDLRALDLEVGAAVELRVPLTAVTLRLGGQDYEVRHGGAADLSVGRSLSGTHLHLRAEGDLVGPCWRCLEDAAVRLTVDSREFAAEGRDPDAPFDDDLDSVYVEDEHADVALWVRDAFAEAVPPMVLCREDCAGLCPSCGANLNEGPCGCPPPAPDSRWGALRDLADRMGLDEDA